MNERLKDLIKQTLSVKDSISLPSVIIWLVFVNRKPYVFAYFMRFNFILLNFLGEFLKPLYLFL